MKKIKEVELILGEDDNGMYGFRVEEEFDSFYSAIGLFHDIFEHSHENNHKYFKGKYAMNIGGEMAAMGGCFYFYDVLQVSNRIDSSNSFHYPEDQIMNTTKDMIVEILQYDYFSNFGDELLSNVPYQKPIDYSYIDTYIEAYWNSIKNKKIKATDEDSYRFARQYKESLSFRKIADLHRYGFRMAEKLVPNNRHNQLTLYNFIDVWNTFFNRVDAKELCEQSNKMTFKIYKEKGEIHWTCSFYYWNDLILKVTEKNINRLYRDDFYVYEDF